MNVKLSPQEMAELANLAFKVAHNEKTREHFALLVNAVDPQMAKGAFGDVIVKRQLDAFRHEIKTERDREKMNNVVEANERQKADTIKKYGYKESDVAELDKIRTQFGLSDWDAAARIYSTHNPPENPELKPPPEMVDGSTWDFPTVPGPDGKMLEFKDYVKNPRKYSNNTAVQMITEFKRGRLPAAFHA